MRRQGPFIRIAEMPYRMSRRALGGLWILIRKGIVAAVTAEKWTANLLFDVDSF
jgi:hypothetical protein